MKMERRVNWVTVLSYVALIAIGFAAALGMLAITGQVRFGNNAPAWVQAVGSIAAIVAAGLIPLWHGRVKRREVIQSLIELISYARFPATLMLAQFEGGFGGPRLILAHLTQLHKAFDSVNYVDIPNRSLAVGVQQAATAVAALKEIQELFLKKGEMKKDRGIEIVQKYIAMFDNAMAEAIKATGQRPRHFGYATLVLPDE